MQTEYEIESYMQLSLRRELRAFERHEVQLIRAGRWRDLDLGHDEDE